MFNTALDGLIREILMDKENGFIGKTIIHPNHVDVINEVFAPNQEEIIQSLRIIKKAEQEGKGAFSLDGKMVDLRARIKSMYFFTNLLMMLTLKMS